MRYSMEVDLLSQWQYGARVLSGVCVSEVMGRARVRDGWVSCGRGCKYLWRGG
jgi:hypothetical protein